jgi:hypothetical protein
LSVAFDPSPGGTTDQTTTNEKTTTNGKASTNEKATTNGKGTTSVVPLDVPEPEGLQPLM